MEEKKEKSTETKSIKKEEKQATSPKQALKKIRVRKVQRMRRSKRTRSKREKDEFETKIISIRRVTRVYKGGKRMRLSVVVVTGDKAGRVGIGVGKGADVKTAETKAVAYAKKHLKFINVKGNTIPHEIMHKYGSAKVFMKPATPGTGIIAGSSVRAVAELAGIKDILTKIIGTKNSITNAYASLEALTTLRQSRL